MNHTATQNNDRLFTVTRTPPGAKPNCSSSASSSASCKRILPPPPPPPISQPTLFFCPPPPLPLSPNPASTHSPPSLPPWPPTILRAASGLSCGGLSPGLSPGGSDGVLHGARGVTTASGVPAASGVRTPRDCSSLSWSDWMLSYGPVAGVAGGFCIASVVCLFCASACRRHRHRERGKEWV